MRVRVNGQVGSAIHPVATLFLGSGAVAVFVALANAAWLAWSTGLSRLRELELARLIHRFMEKIDLDLYEVLPVIVSKPFDLTNATSFFSFLSLAIIVNLFFIWALAVLLFPVVAATARMFPETPTIN